MADLIDRAALLSEIAEDIRTSGCVNHERDILDSIRYAPRVAAEPVVRCKDCENATMTTDGMMKYCKFWPQEDGEALYLPGDFFCGAGERMDADRVDANGDAPERAGKEREDG